eukprot:Transcript_30859.p1 GENE.Transcript_30859~~Transcript_30859.p1  ORF type:complete len:348 (-),score=166.43 Transcript_30859:287-1288(-)
MGAFCERVKPEPSDPDKTLSTYDMVCALACCPSFEAGGETCNAETIDKIEQVLLEQALECDASGLRENTESPVMRRNVLLLFWALYRTKVGADAVELDQMTEQQIMRVKQLATKVLMQAQMLVPQQRWVQATLGVARTSALLVNEVWSHDDDACKARMKEILEADGMLYPRLKLRTRTVAGAADAQAAATGDKKEVKPADVKAEIGEDPDPCSSMPGQAVVVEVEVTREHVGGTASASVSGGPMNPHGILEAYWLYVEGLKPEGTPNSLLGAQPMVVTDLALPVLKGKVSFMAPPTPGEYKLAVHVVSTSVVGIDMHSECAFIVQEDDVPPLQ